jgi:hypothetical protein
MNNELKCPFCQQELRKLFNRYTGEPNCEYECENFKCDLYGTEMPEFVWQALIQAKQDLEIARQALKKIESTEWYDSMSSYEIMTFTAMKALEQIDHIADDSKMVGQN